MRLSKLYLKICAAILFMTPFMGFVMHTNNANAAVAAAIPAKAAQNLALSNERAHIKEVRYRRGFGRHRVRGFRHRGFKRHRIRRHHFRSFKRHRIRKHHFRVHKRRIFRKRYYRKRYYRPRLYVNHCRYRYSYKYRYRYCRYPYYRIRYKRYYW